MGTLAGLTAVAALLLPTAASGQPPADTGVPQDTNLVANGGFDVGDRVGHPTGWSVEGAEAAANVVNLSAYRTAGPGSLELNVTSGNPVTVTSDRMVAAPGAAYTLTARVKGRSGTPAQLSMVFTDFNRTDLGTNAADTAFSTDWQTVTITGTAPAGSAQVTVRIAGGEAGWSYWEQVSLAQAPAAYDPRLGTDRELFLDDYRIESSRDVGRVVHPAKTRPEPLIRPTYPWETSTYIYGSVFKVGKVYRMWYDCNNDVAPGYYLCYAESRDGVKWTKPLGRGTIGYKDIPASRTNLVIAGGGTVAYNPDAPADRRYALMQFHTGVVNETLGYYAYFSPDGYTWTLAASKPVLLDGDVSNVAWDPAGQQYIATVKKRMFTSRTPGVYDRAAFVSTSKDFLTWSTPVLGVAGDYADDGAAQAINGLEGQIYGMPVLPYEGTYIGIPWVLLITNFTHGSQSSAGDGPVLPQLAASRDLVDWSRPVRDPVIQPGKPGAWDDGALYTASNVLVDDRTITMYYGAFNAGHGGQVAGTTPYTSGVGLATWRRDGFVSMTNASLPGLGDPGQLTTKPLVTDGRALHVNADVHAKGSLTVEVLHASGNLLPGYTSLPVKGDQYDAQVRFPGGRSLQALAGQQIKLRFSLVNTDLYAYRVG
ncbi:hypothetical protein Ais01nite_55220 [Asanoa ishikariensis]|uniref:Carbohydrate binding domain-containing protein n=2 Tax=Asanoa ishikariensis TaxID=137265 RepID=A0A1H3TWR1_9ACTN|nr:hypothetical protein Ais01nite_55220 [Asanoa ishikariensis]SDZ53679.1 hypothetical protein SAMN05421684_6381 [Asanoa ishikariensis]